MDLYDTSSLNYISKLIELTDDEFDELFRNFESTLTLLNSHLMPFFHAPFNKERVRDVLSQWYNKIEHNNEHMLDEYVDRYYQQENTHKWFYTIIKHIEYDETRLKCFN